MSLKDELIERKRDLETQLGEINTALSALGVSITDSSVRAELVNAADDNVAFIDSNIPMDGTWIEQIAAVIKGQDRFLHNNEIASALLPLHRDKGIGYIKRRISAVLSDAIRNNKVKGLVNYRFSNSNQDWVWGKQDWLDDQGKIKKEHQFKVRARSASKGPIEL